MLTFCRYQILLDFTYNRTVEATEYTIIFSVPYGLLNMCYSEFSVRLFLGSRLLYLLQQSSSSLELRTECAVVLGSLAMGTENNIKSLVDCHIIPALLQG